MKTLKELRELRAARVVAMKTIQDKGDAIVATDLSTIKTMSDEIAQFDMQIEAINVTRESAMTASLPVEKKVASAKDDFANGFVAYLKGNIDEKELSKFQAAVGAGDANAGKETVPDGFLKELQDTILEYGVIIPDCRSITTAEHGDLNIPTVDDTANAGVWTAEHGAITPADFATDEVVMKAWKVATAITVSTELLEDSAFDIGAYVAAALGVRLSRTMEASVVNGDGSSKPKGIVADTNTASVTSITTIVIEAADALALVAAIQPSQRAGAKFYASDSAIMAMTGWVGTDGRPLLQMSADATQANGVNYTLYGYPVVPNYELGAVTSTGDVPLIFGNPQNYMVRNVKNITVRRSDEVRVLNDEVVFMATARIDGKVVNPNICFAKLVIKA